MTISQLLAVGHKVGRSRGCNMGGKRRMHVLLLVVSGFVLFHLHRYL